MKNAIDEHLRKLAQVFFFGNGPTHPTLCSAHTRGVPMMQFTISSVVSIQIENLSTIGSQMGMNGAVWNLH